jgi:hypothetical protein
MKRIFLIGIVALATSIMAQQPASSTPTAAPPQAPHTFTYIQVAPSYTDLNCAGFITKEAVSHKNEITGGLYFPDQTQFAHGTLFASSEGLQEGNRYTVLRELRDPNHYEPFVGQYKEIEETGQPYAELGTVRVVAIRGKSAVVEVEFGCQNITIGDLVVPYQEHPALTLRKTSTFERFPSTPGHLNARIIMAQEFDTLASTGRKVYLNAGTNKGVKAGDYFRAMRSYDPDKLNPIDNLSYPAPVGEDTQKKPGYITAASAKNLPARATGELVVINVTPTSATAMVTYSVEDIQVGDRVELEGEAPQQPAAPGN